MTTSTPNELVVLDEAFRRLSEVKTLDEIKAIRDKAEAVRSYAQSAKLGLELQNIAAELKLRAERKARDLLSTLKLRGGDRKSNGYRDRLKLGDLGISQNQSKRWQKEATVPAEKFNRYIEHAHKSGVEISAAALIRIARQLNRDRKPAPSFTDGAQTTRRVAATRCPSSRLTGDCATLKEAHEAVAELRGHCQSLANILQRSCQTNSDPTSEQGESRLVARYIAEMAEFIDRLGQLLPPSFDR